MTATGREDARAIDAFSILTETAGGEPAEETEVANFCGVTATTVLEAEEEDFDDFELPRRASLNKLTGPTSNNTHTETMQTIHDIKCNYSNVI